MAEPAPALACHHFEAGRCRSCTLLPQPYDAQLAAKVDRTRSLVDVPEWLPPVTSPAAGFRNKAKMAVAGTVDAPTLGILSPAGAGIDLVDCPLHEAPLVAALPVLSEFVTRARLAPYSVPERRGELKHVLATASPDGELMVRLVLRSREAETRIRKHLPWLLERLPGLRVVSLNLQPEHKAVLEGPDEIVLTPAATLPMRTGAVTLRLRPQSFFQTNTAVATELYATATRWADELAPASVLDLYSGVGGFALHLASPGRTITGVEVSEEAVASARQAAAEADREATFHAGDATAYARALEAPPELVVVNPPRRGIGPELADWLEGSGVPHVLYSSCNPESLARDLARMPSLLPVRGRVLDMFPHTAHHEVLVELARA
ncbi:23S rRNA (uracil(747)-C(5))-methyltransferase RlmC [Nocardioides rotundus]|uniref:23S rRNA (uracil(747)-C(5))-methyltransferase RlmC n=1 Tax=Nocardioides rotundus TaxID=1774216 RepID=UPI001CBD7176|nr:23S rRNA (uracil(747)-C(5))-methyltransferase RlmC [Nocardioides rotundus]UAL29026.1 23S rRNA (uracil(747)-C(5))-methyltransferase RlmC [Nocardioides rotundus]